MGTEALGSLLVRSGALTPEKLREAERRQAVYGGTLDTILLELGAVEERTLLAHLAEATGVPAALPERLGAPDRSVVDQVSVEEARRLGLAPVGRRGDALELALRPGADREAVAAWARERGLPVELVVVPDVRLRELLYELYGDPLTPRLVALVGRLVGAERARRRLTERAPPAPVPPPVVETTGPARPRPPPQPEPEPEPEIAVFEDEPPPPTPPPPPGPPAEELLAALTAANEPLDLVRAMRALGEAKITAAVPLLLARLEHRDATVVSAAHAALVAITRQDFGTRPRPWKAWWAKASGRNRVEWLLEALAHRRPELRLAASEELRALTGVYFGYHFDLPERDREEARRRWADWWRTVGRLRFSQDSK